MTGDGRRVCPVCGRRLALTRGGVRIPPHVRPGGGRCPGSRTPVEDLPADDRVLRPVRPPARDGTYPRCVWCDGEQWALAVTAYSAGRTPCAAVPSCGRTLPADYVRARASGVGS